MISLAYKKFVYQIFSRNWEEIKKKHNIWKVEIQLFECIAINAKTLKHMREQTDYLGKKNNCSQRCWYLSRCLIISQNIL